ncbi:ABC transporter ATP-binding protein [Tumebacillus permanentifrigoris]|uniref:ATP-binding cassette subfamily B protein n=1 Tax=Tumebacillus permanentifrigoris TaxID=378543 RepID=A0A316DZH0_9BACL|nr:ABC transporter ATP-binding protein [Tumebacillus permanentifrigoris]PWK15910.1 ATP-binding cassette subfamily B protein [Tumebacillus permanentifrigoris]
MKNFITLKEFLIAHKKEYLLGIFWVFFVDLIGLITPKIIGSFTDRLSAGTLDHAGIWKYAGIILGVAALTGVSRYFWRVYIMGTARTSEVYLRDKLYSHLQTLSPNFFNYNKTGDLMAHATNDLNAIRMALGPGFLSFIDPMFVLTFTLFMMIYTVGWQLTLLSLAPMPLLILISRMFGKVIHKRFSEVQESFGSLSDRVNESFAGARVVKTFVQEDAEIQKFTSINQVNFQRNLKLARVNGIYNPLVMLVSTFSFLIALSYGGILVVRGSITLGEFISFNTYLALMTWPMMAIGQVINIWQRASASMERINIIMNTKPEIIDGPQVRADKTDLEGSIELRNLTFTYPGTDRPVLKQLNVTIPAGKKVAIIGRTGSGKTTLLSLLLRMYNAPEGQLLIDGIDIHQIPLETLRENIGYVPQENFLFSKSIRDNIGFSGRGSYSQAQIEAAATLAQVHGNILDFTDGYDTMLGERGVTLSGGQKQRVSIARAVIKNPKVLILDDSLSAVDTHTEEEILRGLKEIMQGRTSLIIAHRISTIKDADEILILDDGEIIERGTHEELLTNTGLYYELYQKQLLEEQIASTND